MPDFCLSRIPVREVAELNSLLKTNELHLKRVQGWTLEKNLRTSLVEAVAFLVWQASCFIPWRYWRLHQIYAVPTSTGFGCMSPSNSKQQMRTQCYSPSK